MGTATTSATLLPLALLGWLGAAIAAPAAPVNRGPSAAQAPGQPPAQPPAPMPAQANPAPGEGADKGGPATARSAPPPPGIREKRRRISYASCNRESHRRALRGGARRRFLIRCRLGYERRPTPAGQGTAQAQPPGRRP